MTHWYYLIFFGVLLYSWMVFSIAFHEAAHVLVGKMVGFAPHKITIGKGKLIFRRMLLGVDVHLFLSPVGGFAFASKTPSSGLWWRGSLFLLAGPGAEALLGLLICIAIYLSLPESGEVPNWQIFLRILAAAQVGRLFANIYPRDVWAETRMVPNDGKAFLSYITGSESREAKKILKEYAAVVALYEPDFRPESAWFLKVNGTVCRELAQGERDLLASRFDLAIEKYHRLMETCEMSRGEKAMLLDVLAGIPVIYGGSSYLEKALGWAKQARELSPESVTLAGTLGSLLVESGQYREGIDMLKPITEPGNAATDRAISACYLAKAWDRLGDEKLAAHWIKIAKEGGGCPMVCTLVEPQLSKSNVD